MESKIKKVIVNGLDEDIVSYINSEESVVISDLLLNISEYTYGQIISGSGEYSTHENKIILLRYFYSLMVNRNLNNAFEFLLSELNTFEKLFKKYITIVLNRNLTNTSNFTRYRNNIYEIIEKNSSDVYVLNFNYTSLRIVRRKNELIIEDNPDFTRKGEIFNLSEINVHGDFTSDIIFGIDQSDINPKTKIGEFSFTKTYRKLFQDRAVHSQSLPKENVTDIIFYGHSLAEADYSYFQILFDFYDIYQSNVNIIFKYSIYDLNRVEEIKRENFNRVSKLLTIYGATMSNSHHGKNLMHKLLLENRLQFKEVELTKIKDESIINKKSVVKNNKKPATDV